MGRKKLCTLFYCDYDCHKTVSKHLHTHQELKAKVSTAEQLEELRTFTVDEYRNQPKLVVDYASKHGRAVVKDENGVTKVTIDIPTEDLRPWGCIDHDYDPDDWVTERWLMENYSAFLRGEMGPTWDEVRKKEDDEYQELVDLGIV